MLYKVRSLGLQGISGYEVTAECDLASGLPNFDIVGLPDTAVKEARERVRSAIKNNGYPFPVGRITVNLAPANLRKSGTIYDLPICVGILAASGQLTWSDPHCAFVGELSLSGTLRPVVGMLPMALAARDAGIQRLFVPADSAPEATLAEGLTVYPVETVEQLAAHLTGQSPITPAPPWSGAPDALPLPDFAEVRGQEPVVYTRPVKGEVLRPFSVETLTLDPTLGDWRTHGGVDLAAAIGTEVLAMGPGTVAEVKQDGLMGTTVVVDQGDGLRTTYANLAAKPTVSEGDTVRTGDILGAVGDTAIAESGLAPHLHLETRMDGQPVDPMSYLDQA